MYNVNQLNAVFLVLQWHLVDVSPVLAAVVKALPHHAHDLGERHHVES